MPRKLLALSLTFALLLTLTLQLSSTQVFAITPPITPPVTTPITFANLVGKVTYKQLGRLFGNATRIMPASNVTVKVRGFFNRNQKFQTTTDANGNYSLNVPEGKYEVRVSGGTTDFWVPPFRFVSVKNTSKETNFQGLLFPHF